MRDKGDCIHILFYEFSNEYNQNDHVYFQIVNMIGYVAFVTSERTYNLLLERSSGVCFA